MLYSPCQHDFVESFIQVFKEQPAGITPVFETVLHPSLDGVRFIPEPKQEKRREGRTTALAQVFQRLFLLRRNEPTRFAYEYAGLDKDTMKRYFLYFACLTEVADIVFLFRSIYLSLCVKEVLQDYRIYYLTPWPNQRTILTQSTQDELCKILALEMASFLIILEITTSIIPLCLHNLLNRHTVVVTPFSYLLPDIREYLKEGTTKCRLRYVQK